MYPTNVSIGPGSLRRAKRGHKNLALVLRPLTYEEVKEYGYYWMEDGDLTEHVRPAWMTLHLETGEQVPHGEDALESGSSWANEDV